MSRRRFLTYLGGAAVGAVGGAAGYSFIRSSSPSRSSPTPSLNIAPFVRRPKNRRDYISDEYIEFLRWLRSVSERVKGQTIKVALEDDPQLNVIRFNRTDFTENSGVQVEHDMDAYAANLYKTVLAVTTRSPTYDVMNIDASNTGRFKDHLIPPKELMQRYPELTYPGLDLSDIGDFHLSVTGKYPPDVYGKHLGGEMIQMPVDAPLMITFYRRDLYEEEKRALPDTWDEYIEDAKHFHHPEKALWGTVLQSARFISLTAEYHNHLHSFGGKLWNINEEGLTSAIDSDEAIAALENYAALIKYSNPTSIYGDWINSANLMGNGWVALALQWQDFAINMDLDPVAIQAGMVGKVGYKVVPSGPAGYSSHFGGSGLGIPKYSRHIEAAWLWVQWATCKGMQISVVLDELGKSSPIRRSTFQDPVVKNAVEEGPGWRHFEAVKKTLEEGRLNARVSFPRWDEVNEVIMSRLYDSMILRVRPRETLKAAKREIDALGPTFSF